MNLNLQHVSTSWTICCLCGSLQADLDGLPTAVDLRTRALRTGNPKSRNKRHIHKHNQHPKLNLRQLPSLFKATTRTIALHLARSQRKLPPRALRNLLAWRKLNPSTLQTWTQLLASAGNLPFVLETLGLLEAAGQARRTDVPCPDWLFLALPGLLRTRDEAPYLVGLLLGERFRQLDGQNQGMFVARCVQHLLRARHYVAVEELVEWFTTEWGLRPPTEAPPPPTRGRRQPTRESRAWHANLWGSRTQTRAFGRVLSALGTHRLRPGSHHAPPPALLHGLARKLTAALKARELPPTMDVFIPLFSASLVPTAPREATLLLLEMHQSGLTPPDSVLHTVMKVYGAAGDAVRADKIWQELELRRSRARGELTAESAPAKPPFDVKWATTRLRAMGARGGGVDKARAFFEELRSRESEPLDLIAWNELLRLMALQKYLSADALVDFFDRFEASVLAASRPGVQATSRPPRPGLRSYTILIQGLTRRKEHDKAIEYWNRFLDQGQQPDGTLLGLTARAFASSPVHGPRQAEELLRAWAFRPGVDPLSNLLTRKGGWRGRKRGVMVPDSRPGDSATTAIHPDPAIALTRGNPHSIQLDAVAVNSLLLAYSRAGQYRRVHELWLTMRDAFGAEPDMASLSLLLDSARFASAKAGNGYGPGLESLDGLGEQAGDKTDVWGNQQAWKVAERVMWDVLDRNWPGVVLDDPLKGGDPTTTPTKASKTGLRAWFSSHLSPDDAPPSSAFATTLSPFSPALYPHLHPTLPVFRSFVQLLGYHSSPLSVLRALAWMRHLHVLPDRRLLTLALMYVGEAGLTERETGRLREWCAQWVGENGVPTEAEVAWVRSGGYGGKPR